MVESLSIARSEAAVDGSARLAAPLMPVPAAAPCEGGPLLCARRGYYSAACRVLDRHGGPACRSWRKPPRRPAFLEEQEREFLRQARAWTLAELDTVQPQILAADCLQDGRKSPTP